MVNPLQRLPVRRPLLIFLIAGIPALGLGAEPTTGPLRVHPQNPRYFTDGTKTPEGALRAVYLTGSHTWTNLIDRGPEDPPPVFDFDGYLDFLKQYDHNFVRLWSRHVTWYHGYGEGELHAAPLAWLRSGPGQALDGKPKFDLTKFNQAYFDRLRSRITAAGDRGIYVSIMLFGGSYECRGGWRGNPFHALNNVNGVNGDPNGDGEGLETHTLDVPEIRSLQENYVRKVIETVNDLDNVLYEISNEGDETSAAWQYHFVRCIHDDERRRSKQHPVGMTALYLNDPAVNDRILSASDAEWVSPLTDALGVRNLAAADGAKVSLLDSDHWFVVELYGNAAFGREWVWKSFCRGHNPILMEHLPPRSFVQNDHPISLEDPGYVASREAMGQTRKLAARVNLASMSPRNALASTGYCLANPGVEYVIYQPAAREVFSVELKPGTYRCEWWSDPSKGVERNGSPVHASGGRQPFEAPFDGDAVLYLEVQ